MTQTDVLPEKTLADFVAHHQFDALPKDVIHEAKRSILNTFATAFAGSREPAIGKYLKTVLPYSGPATASLIGRPERVDMPTAAFANAAAANIHDFDDTHLPTIIHPTAPVAHALFAQAEERTISGKSLLHAFILGAEIECRIGNAVSPSHYSRGWHITSTCGVFGSALGTGALLGLTPNEMGWAISNAAAQSAGLVETLGTMSKSLSLGNASRHGVLAAQLAQQGFSGPTAVLTGERGYLRVYCDAPHINALTDGLGTHWEIATNTYKSYPVGVVLNPVIDACIKLHQNRTDAAQQITSLTISGHPLLRARTDRPDVTTGREAQVSAQHAVAITLERGTAGLDDFTDAAVTHTLGARPNITFIDEKNRDIASAKLVFQMNDGSSEVIEITSAKGSPQNPLTDADLERKLMLQAQTAGHTNTAELIQAIWSLDTLADAGAIPRLASMTSG